MKTSCLKPKTKGVQAMILLDEAKSLYSVGFSILWLHPKSKAPIDVGWTKGPRKTWGALEKSYQKDFNMGVRLGSTSKVLGKYLAVIDVDIKSTEKFHRLEVEEVLKSLGMPSDGAIVVSGRGNGSRHIYVTTDEPARPYRMRQSKDTVKVLMPSTGISKAQTKLLTKKELDAGYRIRPAWEISVMGEGQQVVLPPSIHPDTGTAYRWAKGRSGFPSYSIDQKAKVEITREITSDWQPESFAWNPTDEILNLLNGDFEDRSAGLFKAVHILAREGMTDKQIMTVLTDEAYPLSATCYDHAKTQSRERAANWLFNYTIKKIRANHKAELDTFALEIFEVPLDDAEALKQCRDLCGDDWRDGLDRYGEKGVNAGKIKPSLHNVLLILSNAVDVETFKKDVFALREIYGAKTPWGGRKNDLLADIDTTKIKVWLINEWGFEPKDKEIEDTVLFLTDQHAFNPVKDTLEALPEWDGVNRLDTWLAKNFEAKGDPEYLAQVFRKWMVAHIMRVYQPGSKFDWMPIFEGKQGIGKSSLGRLLFGEKFFLDWLPDLANKDSALALQGAWSVEFSELASLRKWDFESTKAFITRTVDKFRPPFGHRQIESPRHCVFFGTTNADTYLKDETGNRRFKPVKVGQLNFKAVEADRLQLLCESLFIWKNGFETALTMELDGKAKEFEHEIQSEKMVEDESNFMVSELEKFIQKESEESTHFDFAKFRLIDLFGEGVSSGIYPLSAYKKDQKHMILASKALKTLGGEKWRSHGKVYWTLKIAKNGRGCISPHTDIHHVGNGKIPDKFNN